MLLRLLLILSAFPLVSNRVSIDELSYKPYLIHKKSIINGHRTLTKEPLFQAYSTLVFLNMDYPRGYLHALNHGKYIEYVSNEWYDVIPVIHNGPLIGVKVLGREKMIKDFIHDMRKNHSHVKFVPRFKFQDFIPEFVEQLVKDEFLVEMVAKTIAKYCNHYGFDGAVIDTWQEFNVVYETHKLYLLETWEQIGKVLQKSKLYAILSIPSPGEIHRQRRDRFTQSQYNRLFDAYDRVHMWTNPEYADKKERILMFNDYVNMNFDQRQWKKLSVGIHFYGIEHPLDKYRHEETWNSWEICTSSRYLSVLHAKDSVLTFNERHKVHELVLESENVYILFPTLTMLEYRLRQRSVMNIGIHGYGAGLDYFNNLI